MKHPILPPRAGGIRALVKFILPVLLFAGAGGWAASAVGAVRNWTGSASVLWSNPNNWNPVGAPQNGEDLVFDTDSNTSMVNDLVNLSVALSFYEHDFQLSGNTLKLAGSSILIYARGGGGRGITINCGLELAADGGIEVGSGSSLNFLPGANRTVRLRINGSINLHGHDLSLKADTLFIQNGLGDEWTNPGHLIIPGVIQGGGNVTAFCSYDSILEFGGGAGNTFNGTLSLDSVNALGYFADIRFTKTSGVVVSNRLVLDYASLSLTHPEQIGDNAAVVINAGSKLLLNGLNETIGSLALTNFGGDALPSLVDTAGGVLTLNGGITTMEDDDNVFPTVKGTLSLPAGLHVFDINSTAVLDGLDMQARVIGSGGIAKQGNAALFLRTSNTFLGNLIISQGAVEAGHSNALGTTASGTILEGGALVLRHLGISLEALTVNHPASQLLTFGTSSWGGNIALNQQLTVYGQDLYISGGISGTGDLYLLGPAIDLISGTPNTFTGTTRVHCDLLTLGKLSSGDAFAFSGPLVIGSEAAVPVTVRWLNDFQINRSTASVTLHSNALMNLNGYNDSIGSLIFNGGSVQNMNFGRLDLAGNVTVNPSSVSATISGGRLGLAPGQRLFHVQDGPVEPELWVTATVMDAGGLTKSGAGYLGLAAANSFAGPVTISGGVLHILNSAGLGTTGAGTTVQDGGTLKVESVPALAEPLNLRGAGRYGTDGALHLLPGAGVQSGIVLDAAATVRVDSSFSLLSGIISGTGPLTKVGNGSLNLGGGSGGANTFTGDTVVAAGEMVLFKPNAVAAVPGNLIVGTGVVGSSATAKNFSSYQINGNITVNAGSLLDVNGQTENVDVLYLNGGGDVQTGAGTLILKTGGAINVSASFSFSSSSVIAGALDVLNGNFLLNVGADSPTLPYTPALDIPADVRFAGGISALTKVGGGTLRLAGSNTFNGEFNINEGRVIAAHNSAFGNSINSTFVHSNATLALVSGFAGGEFLILDSAAQPALEALSGSSSWNGAIQLNRESRIGVTDPAGALTLSGIVSGAGGLTKVGGGGLILSGASPNSYAGLTIVSNGAVEVTKSSGVLGVGGDVIVGDPVNPATNATLRTFSTGHLRPGASVLVNRSGLFDVRGLSLALRTLTGAGRANLGLGAALIISNDVPCDFSGTFFGAGSLAKRGAATLQLRGDSPSYTGAISNEAGTLLVHGAMPNAPLFARNSSTVGGSGSVGDLSALDSSTVAPSTVPQTGRATTPFSVKSFSFSSTAKLDVDIANPYGNDYLYGLSSTASLGGALLNVRFSSAPAEGDVIPVVRNNVFPSAPITGIFGGLPEGAIYSAGGYSCVVRYNVDSFSGKEVTLTVTNLPLRGGGQQLVSGDNGGALVPNDCSLLSLVVTNRSASTVTNLRGTLRSLTAGVVVTANESSFPNLAPNARGTNTQSFQLRTEPTFPCNSSALLELTLTGSNMPATSVRYTLPGGPDCGSGGGACESCFTTSGALDESAPTATLRLARAGSESVCSPPKPCPGVTNLPPAPYRAHAFTNTSASEVCVTVKLRPACTFNDLRLETLAAHLGTYNAADPCASYLGDLGTALLLSTTTPPFAFRVPAGARFEIVVTGNPVSPACAGYALELFGLPCPPPRLQIVRDTTPGRALLQWSSAYPDHRLQSTNSLRGFGPNAFTNVNTARVLTSGRYTVTNSAAAPRQFFRLAR